MDSGVPKQLDPNKPAFALYEGMEYQEFWAGAQKRKLDELEQWIVNYLLPPSGRRIVDIGCGFGRLADCYRSRFQNIVMYDGSFSLLQQAREKVGERAIYIAGDVNQLPFQPAAFDALLAIRVLHHIPDLPRCLNELQNILCANGKFVFNYSNKRNPMRFFKWLVGRDKKSPFIKEPAGIGSEFIHHHPMHIDGQLTEAGFTKIEYLGAGIVDKFVTPVFPISQKMPAGKALSRIFGYTKLAPWMFGRAGVSHNRPMLEPVSKFGFLLCPSCKIDLSEGSQVLTCKKCARKYPIIDGIIDFRIPDLQ